MSDPPFAPPSPLRLHEASPLLVTSSFLTHVACEHLRDLCEGAWPSSSSSSSSSSSYSFSTEDVEVDRCPALRQYLCNVDFMAAVAGLIQQSHGSTITALDDLFLVKYDASGGQVELKRHQDSGDISFMVSLSPPDAYQGGGTGFELQGADSSDSGDGENEALTVVRLAQGEMVVFPAGIYHRGLPITAGTRLLLVGFCHTSPLAASEPGNLSLDRLQSIQGGRGERGGGGGGGEGAQSLRRRRSDQWYCYC